MTTCKRAERSGAFLRFAADHLPAGTENSFWFKLVNSTTSGVANLTNALGTAPYSLMRDWAISLYPDDNARQRRPEVPAAELEHAERVDERRRVVVVSVEHENARQ